MAKEKRNYLRIREVMERYGVTVADIAERMPKLDKDGNVIGKYSLVNISERINGQPSPELIRRLARAIGCKIGEFLPPEEQYTDSAPAYRINASTDPADVPEYTPPTILAHTAESREYFCPRCGTRFSVHD